MKEKQPEKKTSRRDLLAVGASFLIGTASPAVLFAAFSKPEKIAEERDSLVKTLLETTHADNRTIQKVQRFFERVYGVRVEFNVPATGDGTTAKPVQPEDAHRGLLLLFQALGRYPAGFLGEGVTPRIVLARSIRIRDDVHGLKMTRSGAASFQYNWFAVDPLTPPDDFEGTVHHELFHILIGRDSPSREEERNEWTRITVGAGSNQYGPVDPSWHRREIQGPFVCGYGAVSPSEDQATFAHVMLAPQQHLHLLGRMEREQNPWVRAAFMEKYARMKALYLRWSGGRMNETYWKDLFATGQAPYPPSVAELTNVDQTGLGDTQAK